MSAQEMITKAKIRLIINHPFFATIMLSLQFHSDTSIETGGVDGKTLSYNPTWIESQTISKVEGFIAHECMHVSHLHHLRKGNRDHQKWNMAADYAINQLLVDTGFDLPTGGCIDKQYKDMSAEEIYSKLPLMPPQNPKQENEEGQGNGKGKSPDPGKNGAVNQPQQAQTQAQVQQLEAETKQLVAQAAQIAKQQGKLPKHLERLINEVLEPKVNWKDLLNNFLTEVTRNDYTFRKPSKRYIGRGLYLPSLESIEKGKFVLIIDTSGSIDDKLLQEFIGEMQSILADSAQSITVYQVDSDIQEIQEFESDEQIDLKLHGGGGTDFKPAFDHMQENEIDTAAIVYFTDGFCNSFPKDPSVPTMWATYDNKNFVAPFGEVIHLSQFN